MKALLVLCAVLGASTGFSTCGLKGTGSRIINGVPAGHGEFPWQISLRHAPTEDKERHVCGGTLIAPNWVLCASHCFDGDQNPEHFRVRVGEWHQKRNDGTEKDFTVEKIILHEEYDRPHPIEHDVSLIKLRESVDFSGPYAGAACLPREGDDYHKATGCWVSGWGMVSTNPSFIRADQLQKLRGRVWEDEDLKARWPQLIWPGMIGFGTDMESACMGDSGGPLVCPSKSRPGRFDVVGIVSWGRGPTCQGAPGVFTEVAHFVPWIWRHM